MTEMADNEAATMNSQAAVPSIALQITRKNGERFVEACEVLKVCLASSFPPSALDVESAPLFERVFAAISDKECRNHHFIASFLDRIQMSSLTDREKKAAALLFYDCDKSAKLLEIFTVLSTKNDKSLDRFGLISLFRTILTAITSAIHSSETNDKDVVVVGQPSKSPERPNKKAKHLHGDETEEDESRVPCQSPSWDSSLATLRDEDDLTGLTKEVHDIAVFAADAVLQYDRASQTSHHVDINSVNFSTFSRWYNENGGMNVPWIELIHISKWQAPGKNTHKSIKPKEGDETTVTANMTNDESSPASLATEDDTSRTLVSFDFSGLGSPSQMLVTISEDNLHALRELVQRTHLMQLSASDVCKLLLQGGFMRPIQNGKELLVLRKEDFRRVIRSVIPGHAYSQLSTVERDLFMEFFEEFFAWFQESKSGLNQDEVDLKEFAVGFCFFCAGNKSTKLSTGFELLDNKHRGYLTEDQLLRYLQSYLTMLVGMSLLWPVNKLPRRLSTEKRKTMRTAIENGAKWTLVHFLRASGKPKNEYTFENFASWYSDGGFNTAPWLELLDLNKVMSLIGQSSSPMKLPPLEISNTYKTTERRPRGRDRVSSLRRHHLAKSGLQPEILFTFPLGNRRSLIVLKDDAIYVRAVVEKLGLLTMKPDDLWSALSSAVEKRRPPTSQTEIAVYVNMDTFVQSMQEIIPRASRKRPNPSSSNYAISSSVEEILSNFYQCFDIDQCDSVALDELMGGLTLLCGGKKSHKLAFAFSIFDTRQGVNGTAKKRGVIHSLSGEDLFLFLRSILIVTFSTCRQSLDLTDEMVGRCIADTSNMICNDVMRHQWETKRLDRLDFDEFGQWYNDGGYERAPWLELLDLRKWVLLDDLQHQSSRLPEPSSTSYHRNHVKPPSIASVPSREIPILPDISTIPPPPPEDALDTNFFDTDALMPMDSMDDMDMILMQPSTDKDDFPKIAKSFSYSPRTQQPVAEARSSRSPLKFHLNTSEEHGGYMLSLSQIRIRSFRRFLESCGLHQISCETACNYILANGSRSKITKKDFDDALRNMMPESFSRDRKNDRFLKDMLNGIFAAFDRECKGEASALEVACGFAVLCRGKKSDKLEFAFEVLDRNKHCRLSTADMASYLQSFLSVLLAIAFSETLDNDPVDDTVVYMNGWYCDRTTPTLIQAAKAGAEWAASLAFRDFERNSAQKPAMSFDNFADWYTQVGYSSIPWLELLDLQKWAMISDTK